MFFFEVLSFLFRLHQNILLYGIKFAYNFNHRCLILKLVFIKEENMERFDNPDVIITDVIRNHAKWRKKKTALVCGNQRYTWGEFNERINRLANGLIKLGLKKGDKVSMLMTNSIEMVEILFGTVKAGGVIVQLSAMVPGNSLEIGRASCRERV